MCHFHRAAGPAGLRAPGRRDCCRHEPSPNQHQLRSAGNAPEPRAQALALLGAQRGRWEDGFQEGHRPPAHARLPPQDPCLALLSSELCLSRRRGEQRALPPVVARS